MNGAGQGRSTASPAALAQRGQVPAPAPSAEVEPHPVSNQLTRLFAQHADFVQRALLRSGVPAADVDDALQEVFLVVANRLDSYVERGAMRPWLFVIARQVALHTLRSERRRARQPLELVQVSPQDDPHQNLQRREAISIVHQFLSELDERLAQVFYLAEIEQFSVPEIAAALSVKLNTVYSRLRLARQRFEQRLAALRQDMP